MAKKYKRLSLRVTKAVALLSGGKDSFLSALIAMESGLELEEALIVDAIVDSPMFHFPNLKNADLVASLLGLPAAHVAEKEFDSFILSLKSKGIEAIVSGAIASDYQATRIERLCTESGMLSFTPLWRKNPVSILDEIILRSIDAIIISVSAEGLDSSFLGRHLDANLISDLKVVAEKHSINIAGEGGEYETFVLGFPGSSKILIRSSRVAWEGSSGRLELECYLEAKE